MILTVLFALALSPALAEGLRAEPDRDRVAENETLTLRLIADGKLDGDPDFAPLEADFEIISRNQSSRVSIVNGSMSQTTEWVLELSPRRVGRLQIPSVSIGAARSAPVGIEVVPAGEGATASGARSIFVDTAVENRSPYVQQAFEYRARVLYREQPQRAVLSDPQVEGATIVKNGDDQQYTDLVDGLRYTVVERRFLVVPQRSGPLTIQGPRLEARLPDERPGARRRFSDLDDMFGGRMFQQFPGFNDLTAPSRRVVERGPDLTVDVRPQPAGSASPWLPAESIQLSDEWTPTPPEFRVGEPVTRTLVITAKGATAAQLPALDLGTADGVKIYPEQPQAADLPGSGSPAATLSLSAALVPTRPGALTLPEIRLHWWDTAEDRERVAVVPQRTVQVAAAAGAPEAPPASVDPGSERPAATPVSTKVPETGRPVAASAATGAEPITPWPWLSLLFGVGWLATLAWLVWERRSGRRKRPRTDQAARRVESLKGARRRARDACAAGDARGARSALLDWGRARWPEEPPLGLGDLASRIGGTDTGRALEAIDRAIYAPAGSHWDGRALWSVLEPRLVSGASGAGGSSATPLPELYPERI